MRERCLPATFLQWRFHGNGLTGFGGPHGADRVNVDEPGDDEVWARVDALGICASDAKMVRLGGTYPLFFDRDFEADPAVLGHEVALTLVHVGARWTERYRAGQRFGLQPDVFIDGRRMIFGVNLPGGMAQYVKIEPAILEGGYLFDVPDGVAAVEVALTEPWACVDVAFARRRRVIPLAGGVAWFRGVRSGGRPLKCSLTWPGRKVVVTDPPPGIVASLRASGCEVLVLPRADERSALTAAGVDAFDDVVLFDPRESATVAGAVACLATDGCLNLALERRLDHLVEVDPNRLHYERLAIVGTRDLDVARAYGWERNRSEIVPRGTLVVLGASGTMGRMHLDRVLRMPDPPGRIIAGGRDRERMAHLETTYAERARASGVEFIVHAPGGRRGNLAECVAQVTDGRGCDDVVVVSPAVERIEEGAHLLAPGGALNIFAGVGTGQRVHLPLDRIATEGLHVFGTSGSVSDDQREVIRKTLAGTLVPADIVAAVGGIHAVRDAIAAVTERRYTGKIVIYPGLEDLPLTDLAALADRMGERMRCVLGLPARWSKQAEKVLMETLT